MRCDEWSGPAGVCRAIARDLGAVERCPRERAANAARGECCHHPFRESRERLAAMREAGVDLARFRAKYGKRLLDPEFVERLWAAFERRRA